MRPAIQRRGSVGSGFTLLELMVALTIFAVVGYSLVLIIGVGSRSQRTVSRVTSEDKSLRAATLALVDELEASSDATITITALPDGNHQVRFQQPIDDAGTFGWGVYDRTLGTTPATQNRVGWKIQYTVRTVAAATGSTNKQLLRQVLDAANVVQSEKVIAQNLRAGNVVPPGFQMVRNGTVWELTLSLTHQIGHSTGIIKEVFHVQTRN